MKLTRRLRRVENSLNPPRRRADGADQTRFPTAMNLPFHLFRLEPAPTERDGETLRVASRADVQWCRPVFRAPALPTPHQLSSELPFSVNFPAKLPRRR